MTYRLHYAPDNASLAIRLALGMANVPFVPVLVDRHRGGQRASAYLALNPNGLIPLLETPDGPLFETGAILLWLSERHPGLAPAPADPARGAVLTWLFWLANTLPPAETKLFYPDRHTTPQGAADLTARTCARIVKALDILEGALPRLADWIGTGRPSVLDCYLGPLLRWPVLYAPGAPAGWYDLRRWPGLFAVAARLEHHPAAIAAARAEGLGPYPFTAPTLPAPPEGSAI